MKFHIVTLFPEFFDSPLSSAMLGKGAEEGLVAFTRTNPRDFTEDRHRTVDDRPYGGGPGMVMMCEPLSRALDSIETPGRMLALTPRGRPLDQAFARELAAQENLTLICGRYEGIDERIFDQYPIEGVSVGDFVLNGGEAAALCVIESVARLVPEFMGHEDSGDEESFSHGLLEYPHYTRPPVFRGQSVPDILTCGDHGRIAAWRRHKALEVTLANRPDILEQASLTGDDIEVLREIRAQGGIETLGRNLYVALLHAPVLNKFGQTVAVSLTNLDVHDIARVSRTYGLGGYYIATPLTDQRNLLERLVGHWVDGPGQRANRDRTDAFGAIRTASDLFEIIADVERRAGQRPVVVATTARGAGNASVPAVRQWLADKPVLLVMGTASGLAPEVMEDADAVLRPVRGIGRYNHLSVRSATAIIVDRVLGDAY
ncbi:tRNA (guanine37-N1)-methyltransferase [Desulfobaculum xiamenense]|uniref:tRNA (guanine-N(1)-)-methyltransferase n=1 Tax=Desulfobaculum xiamenense TaxID=995050 RepID=A0A846QQ19_9BACT|nr:tRNA (guanine37-N1)-methyltransferase [Desulfobaculum xiamenense]